MYFPINMLGVSTGQSVPNQNTKGNETPAIIKLTAVPPVERLKRTVMAVI
jgi:hypothetical protein